MNHNCHIYIIHNHHSNSILPHRAQCRIPAKVYPHTHNKVPLYNTWSPSNSSLSIWFNPVIQQKYTRIYTTICIFTRHDIIAQVQVRSTEPNLVTQQKSIVILVYIYIYTIMWSIHQKVIIVQFQGINSAPSLSILQSSKSVPPYVQLRTPLHKINHRSSSNDQVRSIKLNPDTSHSTS